MSPALDDLSMQFALFARTAPGDVLDMGCGDGIATAPALARGARIYAEDCDQAVLHHPLARVPPVHAPRLRVRIGTLPGANFKYPRFSAVHVSRVFQFSTCSPFSDRCRSFCTGCIRMGSFFSAR
jgi:hypothetical protein